MGHVITRGATRGLGRASSEAIPEARLNTVCEFPSR